jgi:hypothetical protein
LQQWLAAADAGAVMDQQEPFIRKQPVLMMF